MTLPNRSQPNNGHVLNALKHWHNSSFAAGPFSDLVIFKLAKRDANASDRYCTNLILDRALARLEAQDVEAATLLRRRFLDGEKARTVAAKMNLAESTFYERQQDAVRQLTDIILAMEAEALSARLDALEPYPHLSPPPRLIAIDRHLGHLGERLMSVSSPWIIAIEGIGGIGKTTLTQALVRHVFAQDSSWASVAWVTARQSELTLSGRWLQLETSTLSVAALCEQLFELFLPHQPRPITFEESDAQDLLRDFLRKDKYLVVIDNLETVPDVTELMPLLRRWCDPSKFVLTSRENHFVERNVYHYLLPELSRTDALALIRLEAEENHLPHVVEASDTDLMPIYETVGGNPLALRLVAGQLHSYGLNEVLTNISQGIGDSAENLQTHIYRQAWARLSEVEQHVLIAMTLVNEEGDTIDEIATFVNVTRSQLAEALGQLVRLNLVNSRATLRERRYFIHNLTRTFLHQQVSGYEG
ncbi:MAG: hypothetical protein H6642_05555 [Caldilineaceae bacterium]|nr:hypothetical protein [Caldilineaceae bacterium]